MTLEKSSALKGYLNSVESEQWAWKWTEESKTLAFKSRISLIQIKALLEHDLETQKTISSGLAMGLIFVVLFFFMFKKGKFQITKMEGNMQNSSSVNT